MLPIIRRMRRKQNPNSNLFRNWKPIPVLNRSAIRVVLRARGRHPCNSYRFRPAWLFISAHGGHASRHGAACRALRCKTKVGKDAGGSAYQNAACALPFAQTNQARKSASRRPQHARHPAVSARRSNWSKKLRTDVRLNTRRSSYARGAALRSPVAPPFGHAHLPVCHTGLRRGVSRSPRAAAICLDRPDACTAPFAPLAD
jgi:hypothetical protein